MRDNASKLAGILREIEGRFLLFVTGAGVSAASGLSTFRGKDPDAIWARDVLEMGTNAYFQEHPVEWWLWFLDRFAKVFDAKPNAAHFAIRGIEERHTGGGGEFLLITQNVDTLHEQAGSKRLVKVHGTADRVRCSRTGCSNGAPSGSIPIVEVDFKAFHARPAADTVPRCPLCGSLVRAHALLFDEYYAEHQDYGFTRVENAASRAELIVFVGTSFSVGVTDLLTRSAWMRGAPALSIDPVGSPPPRVEAFLDTAEILLPRVCELLVKQ